MRLFTLFSNQSKKIKICKFVKNLMSNKGTLSKVDMVLILFDIFLSLKKEFKDSNFLRNLLLFVPIRYFKTNGREYYQTT